MTAKNRKPGTGPLTAEEHRQYLIATYMLKQLAKFTAEFKGRVSLSFQPGQQTPVNFDLDGQDFALGAVKMSKPVKAWRVTDPEALLAWAKKHRPKLVERVPRLKEGAAEALLEVVRDQNAAVDENGEVIPGIDWSNGSSPSVIVTPDKGLAATLDTLKAEGRLGDVVAGLPQITTGGSKGQSNE